MTDTTIRVLVTGFEAFGELTENPSQIIAEELCSQPMEGVDLCCVILPVSYVGATNKTSCLLHKEDWRPDVILHLGVATARKEICVERFAVNLMDSTNGDNNGCCPDEAPVIPQAPLAYRVTLPCKRLGRYLKNNDFPVQLSNSAGTFVCNAVLYSSLHLLAQLDLPTQCGFIHLPTFHTIEKEKQLEIIKKTILWLAENLRQESQASLSL